jgi:hypothetical protein
MREIVTIVFVSALWCMIGCHRSATSSTSDQHTKPFVGVKEIQGDSPGNIQLILAALKPEEKSARLDLHGTCDISNSDVISVSPINFDSPRDAKNGLLRVKEILRGDRDITVNEDQYGIIRINGAGISDEILKTKIVRLTLNRDEQYDPEEAIRAILSANEVQIAMRNLNTRRALTSLGLEIIPSKGLPHLKSPLENLTVDDALDRVLRKFPGLIEYTECSRPNGKHLFNFTFYDLQ